MPSSLSLSRISIRWQITLLVGVVVVLFLAVLFAASTALRYTKASVFNDERRGLSDTAQAIARQYADRSKELGESNQQPAPLTNTSSPESREILTLLSRVVLENSDGVEGGFYSAADGSVVGYPFSMPDEAKRLDAGDVQADVAAAIIQVARSAVMTGQPSEQILNGMRDTILIEAVPVNRGPEREGSTWVMKREGVLPGPNRFRTYVIAVTLGGAALVCVLLTLLVVRNLQKGVSKVEEGLRELEHDLNSQIQTGTDPGEIQRIIQAVNRLGANLRDKNEHERQMEDKLRHSERLAALGRLVAGVAHEVRNPLTTIHLRLQMCLRNTEDPRQRESCNIALEEVARLNDIVGRLLNFARPVNLHSEPTALSRLAQQRLEGFRHKAEQYRVRFVTDFSGDTRPLAVDPGRMAQVFDNVIQNAIEAMQDRGGTLRVIVSSESQGASENNVSIEFRDTGSGIRPELTLKVFDPFFTTKLSGTGLGLSICHELVRAHGGDIYFTSKVGDGTSVRIILPFLRTETLTPVLGGRPAAK